MSYAAPAFRWTGLRDAADQGRAAVEVPAALSALGPRERELLEARLVVRCRVPTVRVAPDGREVVRFVGPTTECVGPGFRQAADEAIRTVSADAAAGWTADDERERHRPFSWGAPTDAAPGPASRTGPSAVGGGRTSTEGGHRPDGPHGAGEHRAELARHVA